MSGAGTAVTSSPRIHVVAAVLRDARGRVLLTRRTAGRDLAGLWEFPGGKVEVGEAPIDALRRELDEELGLAFARAEPLIAVPHAYPTKRILLDVYLVDGQRGRARGLEAQALAWAPLAKLPDYPMPPADRPVLAALLQCDRYLVTPDIEGEDDAFLGALAGALADGVRRVQLRLRSVDAARSESLSRHAAALSANAGAELLLNSGNPLASELARELGVGLHLTASDLHKTQQRPEAALLAASCHDAAELARAQSLGCDFAVLGPVRATRSHPGAQTLGWDAFAQLRECAALPIYGIGGLGPDDLGTARRHGAQGVAAIRGLWPGIAERTPRGRAGRL